MEDMARELMEGTGWEVESDVALICPDGHVIEWDGVCPDGLVSPLREMGMI